MKRIKKRYIFLTILFLSFLAVSSIYIFSDFFIKIAAIRLTENLFGSRVTIDELKFDGEKNAIHIKGLKMYNPKGFPEGVLIEMPKLTLVGVSVDFENGTIPVDFVDVEINEMSVVKNKDGRFNIDELKCVREGKELGIELCDIMPVKEFNFSMDKVLYRDYSGNREEPVFRVYEVKIKDRKYNHMINLVDLIIIVFHEALGETAIKGAAVLGITTIAGVAFWPLGVAVVAVGRDSTSAEFEITPEEAFRKCIKTIDELGKRTKTKEGEENLIVRAIIEDHNVIVKISEAGEKGCRIDVYARKYFLPMPHFASTVLYQISENIHDPYASAPWLKNAPFLDAKSHPSFLRMVAKAMAPVHYTLYTTCIP